ADAAVTAAAIAGLGPVWPPSQAQTELARARAARALTARELGPPARPPAPIFQPPGSRWLRVLPFRLPRAAVAALAAAAALAALAAVALTPPGRDAAAQLLGPFRGEKFEAVPLEMAQFQDIGNALTELDHIGTVSGLSGFSPSPRTVSSVAEAAQQAGITAQQP